MINSIIYNVSVWGVAVLELVSILTTTRNSDHSPCACLKTHPIDHRSKLNYIADNQTFDCTTFCLEVLTVYGYELHLFWAKIFPLLVLLMSGICHSSISTTFNVFSYDTVWVEHQTIKAESMYQGQFQASI